MDFSGFLAKQKILTTLHFKVRARELKVGTDNNTFMTLSIFIFRFVGRVESMLKTFFPQKNLSQNLWKSLEISTIVQHYGGTMVLWQWFWVILEAQSHSVPLGFCIIMILLGVFLQNFSKTFSLQNAYTGIMISKLQFTHKMQARFYIDREA